MCVCLCLFIFVSDVYICVNVVLSTDVNSFVSHKYVGGSVFCLYSLQQVFPLVLNDVFMRMLIS